MCYKVLACSKFSSRCSTHYLCFSDLELPELDLWSYDSENHYVTQLFFLLFKFHSPSKNSFYLTNSCKSQNRFLKLKPTWKSHLTSWFKIALVIKKYEVCPGTASNVFQIFQGGSGWGFSFTSPISWVLLSNWLLKMNSINIYLINKCLWLTQSQHSFLLFSSVPTTFCTGKQNNYLYLKI